MLREGSAEPDRLTCDRTFQQVASTVDLRLERHFCPIEFAGSLEALSRGIYARGIWQLNATAERATMNRMKDRNSYICESQQHWYAPKPNGDSASIRFGHSSHNPAKTGGHRRGRRAETVPSYRASDQRPLVASVIGVTSILTAHAGPPANSTPRSIRIRRTRLTGRTAGRLGGLRSVARTRT